MEEVFVFDCKSENRDRVRVRDQFLDRVGLRGMAVVSVIVLVSVKVKARATVRVSVV